MRVHTTTGIRPLPCHCYGAECDTAVGEAMGTMWYAPAADEVEVLDALEAAWRAATRTNTARVYNPTADALLATLTILFGSWAANTVRNEMADNFEGWVWNLCVARTHPNYSLDRPAA